MGRDALTTHGGVRDRLRAGISEHVEVAGDEMLRESVDFPRTGRVEDGGPLGIELRGPHAGMDQQVHGSEDWRLGVVRQCGCDCCRDSRMGVEPLGRFVAHGHIWPREAELYNALT